MSTSMLIISALCLLAVCCFLVIFVKPFRSLCSLFLHTALGWAGLYIWNMLIPYTFGINIASATIVGILGVPGVLLLILTKWIFSL